LQHNRRISLLFNIFLPFVLIYSLFAIDPGKAASPLQEETSQIIVEPGLRLQLAFESATGYLIYFHEHPDLSPAYEMDWITRGRFVVGALQQTAEQSQAKVRAYLDTQGADYKAFWIDNIISVRASNQETFDGLMEFHEISALRSQRSPTFYEPVEVDDSLDFTPAAIESNLVHVGADQVWAMGFDGQGIVVANIDTGVRYTHNALIGHYRGNLGGGSFDHNYNWWDPLLGGQDLVPNDWHSHGSHTMGIMVGDDGNGNQIGMAPGAQWIACQAFEAHDDELLECGQFMAAPWDLNGLNPNPDLRPQIINNSWGDCLQYTDHWYRGTIDSWHALGIYPVFSNGNSSNCSYSKPPGLNTVGNPAREGNVTAVGSTGKSDGLYATHSNWGPTDDPDTVNAVPGHEDLKPQVVAPGVSIRSAGMASDTTYFGLTGTSMSAPHVSGLVALMWDAAPCLIGNYATTERIIEQTATPVPYNDGTGGGAHVPNYATGWGEINAYAAVRMALDTCGEFILQAAPVSQSICALTTDEVSYSVFVTPILTSTSPVTLTTLGQPVTGLIEFNVNPVIIPGTSTLTISNLSAAGAAIYAIDILGKGPTQAHTTTVNLGLFDSIPGDVTLLSPLNGDKDLPPKPTFSWQSASQASTYTIEIAEDSDFAHIVVSALVSGTIYAPDFELKKNSVYYWRVRAGNLCGAGVFSPVRMFFTEAEPGSCSYGATPMLLYSEDFEDSSEGWSHAGQNDTWLLRGLRIHSGEKAFYAQDLSTSSDQQLVSPPVLLPVGDADLTLQFWNYQEIESKYLGCYDGAILEISTDGGESWSQLPTGTMLSDPYDGLIDTGGNPLVGRQAWCGDPQDWLNSVVDLHAYGGQTVQFRFRLGTDDSVAREGWFVDDVLVQLCVLTGYIYSFGPDSHIDLAPGSVATHDITLSNFGMADSYTLTLTGGIWPTTLLTQNSVTLGVDENAQVQVQVQVPDLEGTDHFTVTAQSWGDPAQNFTVTGTTNSVINPGVSISPNQTDHGFPGQQIRYEFQISNTGNYTDSFALTINGDWLTSTSANQTGNLSTGEAFGVVITVTIPSNASLMEQSVVTLDVTSSNDEAVSASAKATTTALWYRYYFPTMFSK
jgi:subtilisin family serine protease